MNLADELDYLASAATSAEGLAMGFDPRLGAALLLAAPVLKLVAEAIRGGVVGEITKVEDLDPLFSAARHEIDEREARKFGTPT